jgi:indolepyruvate ferredoxin oxidoreductase
MRLQPVSLGDKYDLDKTPVLLTGSQAIVRACLMQQARDAMAGIKTAGYVSGYRGSPLGGLDQQFARAERALEMRDIEFQPGLNEDLAATAIWGAQQAHMRGEGRFDGVFGVWYGKGPGVDRSGDVFRHANLAGTAPHGGVLALMGDDHTCESSTTAHQSEFALVDAMMPILNPAGVQELVDYALYGWALSRFAGVWVGLKCVKDNIESTATVDGTLDRVKIDWPVDFDGPEDGLNIRTFDPPLAQEQRLHEYKLEAARAFVRANVIDRTTLSGGRKPKIGIVTAGKSYLDCAQALDELGLDEAGAARHGLSLYKPGMVWPLEPERLQDFADGLDLIMVVEEKRALIENQLKALLYGRARAPQIIGKQAEDGAALFPAHGALDPNHIALEIGKRLKGSRAQTGFSNSLKDIAARQEAAADVAPAAVRKPFFCSGCPHNSSTVLPDGARGYAGIGCHWMVQSLDRNTEGYTHMGGEGANWIGEAPFSTRSHIFQNLGDGTYNHSGSLAIRAAKAAGVNITFKVLYNDAVAMTGGQPLEGGLEVADIAWQVRAENVAAVAIVSERPKLYRGVDLPAGCDVTHRDRLNEVQRSFEQIAGVSVLIYDQTCAAEKRRRRKRNEYPDPNLRAFINPLVCEGCGDCSVQSNCLAIAPLDTPLGRKRRIDQSMCNKDFSCLKGFCPSFVTVEGALRTPERAGSAIGPDMSDVPAPDLPKFADPYSAVIAGVGGTGIVTIAALMAMAAHLEGKACGVIDMAGLAQKGGAVLSHVKIADKPADIQAIRVAAGGADLVLGCDLVVAGSAGVLATMLPGRTRAAVNTEQIMPSDFTLDKDYELPAADLADAISERLQKPDSGFIAAGDLARHLLGDTIGANILLLGYAVQRGFLPLSPEALERAIELNGVAVENNLAAFRWGRKAALGLTLGHEKDGNADDTGGKLELDDRIAFYARHLAAYQDDAYARRFRDLIARVGTKETEIGIRSRALEAVCAAAYFRILAYKDEYEVARLFTDGRFEKALEQEFATGAKFTFHFAPPIFAKPDPATGRPKKRQFGPWVLPALRLLAHLRFLRGGPFDPFGRFAERRAERRLIELIETAVADVLATLNRANHAAAVELLDSFNEIKGFGPVKTAAMEQALAKQVDLWAAFHDTGVKSKQLV